jgi:phenylacetate-CoA ligase
MFGEWIRNCGFWLVDTLNGGNIRRHYFDIKRRMEKDGGQRDALKSLLYHASETTGFYAPYKSAPLESFPIIDKNIIRDNYDNILSSQYKGKKLHRMSTSGSTGTPFTIVQDAQKRSRVLAEVTYFGEQCGYHVGDRYAFIRTWTNKNRKSPIMRFSQNLVMLDTSVLDEDKLEAMRKTLKTDKNIKCILGYASSLDMLSRYLVERGEGPESFGLKVVISAAEALSEVARTNLKKVFGCPVVSRYSNQENGILAQEYGDNVFVINEASYLMEFLKVDADEPATPGEVSRIVLTDLFNYAMPMIRYDTGDLAIFERHPEYGRVITSIEGKVRDFLYDLSGRPVSPSAISVNMWKFDRVKQFQFIQENENQYILKLNGAKGIYNDDEFIDLIKGIVGQDAEVRIEHVEGISLVKFREI